ncbi:MAG: hypothetical protein MRJ65_11305 [Candidatus Brocadiaceae bacterium]|nr:hypothetical protein [Candidatus Brocadiaceae bacterium]
MPIINLVLLVCVVGLAVLCVKFVYYPPTDTIESIKDSGEHSKDQTSLIFLEEDRKLIDQYEGILTHNPFSPGRQTWHAPEESKIPPLEVSQKKENNLAKSKQTLEPKEKPKGKPMEITLHGIVIFGDTKKALIVNPDKKNNNKNFVFIEEGEEIADYKVKNIEEDRILLDWYGEEHVVVMRSNIKK